MVVTTLQSRLSTTDIDAIWDVGEVMRECINEVGDKFDLGHTWCNCDFKRTKSYTEAIIENSYVYKVFDRLIVRMVNLDLLLAIKLVAFREHKQSDMNDCVNILNALRIHGINVTPEYIRQLVIKYYGSIDVLSKEAKRFARLG